MIVWYSAIVFFLGYSMLGLCWIAKDYFCGMQVPLFWFLHCVKYVCLHQLPGEYTIYWYILYTYITLLVSFPFSLSVVVIDQASHFYFPGPTHVWLPEGYLNAMVRLHIYTGISLHQKHCASVYVWITLPLWATVYTLTPDYTYIYIYSFVYRWCQCSWITDHFCMINISQI